MPGPPASRCFKTTCEPVHHHDVVTLVLPPVPVPFGSQALAVRQSRAKCEVNNDDCPALRTVLGLSRFAAWLSSGHAGLVSGLGFRYNGMRYTVPTSTEIVRHLLTVLLRSAPAAASQMADSRAGAAAINGPLGGLPLQLENFKTDVFTSPALLSALASTNVQQLSLKFSNSNQVTPAVCSALGCLQPLQRLSITVNDFGARRPGDLARAMQGLGAQLQHLEHLTRLTLYPVYSRCFEHLPASLQELCVEEYVTTRHFPADSSSGVASLLHLANLKDLTLSVGCGTHVQLRLPTQLTHLQCKGEVSVMGEHGLRFVEAPDLRLQAATWGILQCLSTAASWIFP